MITQADIKTIRNGLVALQVLALSNADEYLEKLAEQGIKALDRFEDAKNINKVNEAVQKATQ